MWTRKAEVEFKLKHKKITLQIETDEIKDCMRQINELDQEMRIKKLASAAAETKDYILKTIIPRHEAVINETTYFISKYEAELEQLAFEENEGQLEFLF